MKSPLMQQNNGRTVPRLLQLMQANMAAPRNFKVEAAADGAEATMYLYDVIDDYYGIGAEEFITALNAITAPVIHVRINSPGGDVFAARAMATAIRGSKSKVVCHIDGVAASAATTVAIAGAECEIADGAFFMIHQAWTLAYGNCSDLMEVAALLEKIDCAIAADYARKCGKPTDQISQWMADETWFSAQEAVDAGLCDCVCADGAKADNQWNLSAYAKAPKALTDKPAAPTAEERAVAALAQNREALERRLKLYERT